MSLKRYVAYLIDMSIEGILVGTLYQILCYLLSLFLNCNRMDLYFKLMNIFELKILWFTFRLGYNTMVTIFVSIFVVSFFTYFNRGFTIGDGIMKIKIKSTKFNGIKFYLLRFFMRTLTVTFIPVFIIVNLIFMVIYKRVDISWYDRIIGLEIEYK